ncbi:electron transfer flavoprotein subunit alpha/FixB family protein [Radicibacter daui]|uniref:electron transfer flavoprotein subunit alpha/FixB family protein n=1 Tax=Radicibacter daui TaxID=3064829 RepID=UPI004046F783
MSRLRRDPRSEWQARRVPAAGSSATRLRYALGVEAIPATEVAVGPTGRPRRDPRTAVARLAVPGTARLRLDRSGLSRSVTGAGAVSAAPQEKLVIVEAPDFWVLALVEAPGGQPTPHDRQVLGAARLLAGPGAREGGGGVILVSAEPVTGAGRLGADRVVTLPVLAGDPVAAAEALAVLAGHFSARHLLAPESPLAGDLARRTAALLEESLFAEAELVSADQVARRRGAGRLEERRRPPRCLTIGLDRVAMHGGSLHEARELAFSASASTASASAGSILSIGPVERDAATVPLAEAEFVVSAGNGVTDFDLFRQLASALGGVPGASRVVCDAGLMPRDRQVGASGTVLTAAGYFALGIAGAPQHLQGIAGVEHVVAVNTDLHAKMIERASLAVVADAQAVMPALLALLEAGE